MAYDEYLAERIQRILKERKVPFFAKKLFGGVCFMVDEKMCVGILKQELMVRIDPEMHDQALRMSGTQPMDESGKSMKGFIMICPESVDLDEDLEYWIHLALVYNPKAKSSKKK